MVQMWSQESSRTMDDRFQTIEKKHGTIDNFQDCNENKMWLRQKGSVKEFNAFFDDATSNIQLPERYLVMTYVAGLKREIADSVRLFQPRTMREARSLARVQEISLQWRAKTAEQARKDLEYQSKTLLVKNEVQEASDEHDPEEQKRLVAHETNDYNHEVECVTMQEPWELPSTVGGITKKTQEASEVQEREPAESCSNSFQEGNKIKGARGGTKLLDMHEQEELGSDSDGIVTFGSAQTARNSKTGSTLALVADRQGVELAVRKSSTVPLTTEFMLPLILGSLPAALFSFP